MATGGLIATINVLSVKKEVRNTLAGGKVALKLLGGIMKWGEASRAKAITAHVTSGVDNISVASLFERSGFSYIGSNYSI